MVLVRIIEPRTAGFEAARRAEENCCGQDREPFGGLPVICGVDILDDRA